MTQPAAPLLTYAPAASPYPVLVSASTAEPSLAGLTIVVSCPGDIGPCSVSQIVVHLPVGADSDATNLTPTAPPPSAASISSSDEAAWTRSAGIAAGTFVFAPPGGSVVVAGQSLTIQISGIQVSGVVGTANVVVSEWAAPGSVEPTPASAPPSGQISIPIAKFPIGFYSYGFAPSQPEVDAGDSVTLTWVGSANATFTIAYDDSVPAVPVRPPAWTSPQLYGTTSFELVASASEGGQTVSISQTATVTVALPQVVLFWAVPSDIDYQQSVVLHWQTVDADGVYLLTGETGKVRLAKASDQANPYVLQPEYGTTYRMQAYRTDGPAEVTSTLQQLALTYNPVEISFTADPMICSIDNPNTTLSWQVLHAKSVAFDGQEVDAIDTRQETPTPPPSTDELVATWIDGSQHSASVTVATKVATVTGYCATFAETSKGFTVDLTVTTANVQMIEIPKATVRFTMPTEAWESDPVSATGTMVDRTHFEVALVFPMAPGDLSDWPNVGLIFDLKVFGPAAPPETTGNVVMYRGTFD